MKTISLISWNVNGIRAAVRNGFETFLREKKPTILGLQETKIDSLAKAKIVFDFKDYDEYWNSAERKGYSGTALLVRQGAPAQPARVTAGIGVREFDEEGRVQTAEFDTFYLLNIYFPNSGEELLRLNFKQDFNKALLTYALKLDAKKPVIMCGDFNVAHQEIDLKNPKTNVKNAGFTPQERAGMDRFLAAGFVDTFRHLHPTKIQYSWWSYRFQARSRNVGWRIDYFLVSKRLQKKIVSAYIWDTVKGSDHCPVGIDIAV